MVVSSQTSLLGFFGGAAVAGGAGAAIAVDRSEVMRKKNTVKYLSKLRIQDETPSMQSMWDQVVINHTVTAIIDIIPQHSTTVPVPPWHSS